jgi:hypothetical protein
MKRRQFIHYSSAGLVTSLGLGWAAQGSQAQGGGVTIEAYGHMCFRFSGGGMRILSNPFKSQGCTAGLPAPKASADLVLISSQLADEGAVDLVPGNPKLLYEAGNYEVSGLRLQGIAMDHDKNEGNRFGKNEPRRRHDSPPGRRGGTDYPGAENSDRLPGCGDYPRRRWA